MGIREREGKSGRQLRGEAFREQSIVIAYKTDNPKTESTAHQKLPKQTT